MDNDAVPIDQRRTLLARRLRMAQLLVCATCIAGCATVLPAPPVAYDELAQRAIGGETVTPSALKDAFLAAPDVDQRLHQLTLLERQVMALRDEPLRLGAPGSAILDIYYGSLAGHQALAQFYGFVEATEQAERHERWAEAIAASIASSASGRGAEAARQSRTDEAPVYPVLSSAEAEAFLAARGATVAGGAYEVDGERFLLRLIGRAEGEAMDAVLFDLTTLRSTLISAAQRNPDARYPTPRPVTCRDMGICEGFDVAALVRVLAVGGDSAAQTFIGAEMRRAGRFEDTVGWLEQASRLNNGLAQAILAEVYLERALRSGVGDARANYLEMAEQRLLLAIAAGFDSAMSHLGAIYLSGAFGDDKVERGVALLEQAADLDNVDALLNLAALHAFGQVVEQDHDRAEHYFLLAAERNERAKVEYARFLTRPDSDRALNNQAWQWLREVARNDNAQAMLLVGNLYARGEHVQRRLRRARTWLKRAAKAAPDNANLVNEVAWTLTVAHLPRLRDADYALQIMDRVMADEDNPARRTPAYLDTWAAAYAANGDFERAIAVQEEAIQQATRNQDPSNQLPILRKHLDAFRAGEQINEIPWAPIDVDQESNEI